MNFARLLSLPLLERTLQGVPSHAACLNMERPSRSAAQPLLAEARRPSGGEHHPLQRGCVGLRPGGAVAARAAAGKARAGRAGRHGPQRGELQRSGHRGWARCRVAGGAAAADAAQRPHPAAHSRELQRWQRWQRWPLAPGVDGKRAFLGQELGRCIRRFVDFSVNS